MEKYPFPLQTATRHPSADMTYLTQTHYESFAIERNTAGGWFSFQIHVANKAQKRMIPRWVPTKLPEDFTARQDLWLLVNELAARDRQVVFAFALPSYCYIIYSFSRPFSLYRSCDTVGVLPIALFRSDIKSVGVRKLRLDPTCGSISSWRLSPSTCCSSLSQCDIIGADSSGRLTLTMDIFKHTTVMVTGEGTTTLEILLPFNWDMYLI